MFSQPRHRKNPAFPSLWLSDDQALGAALPPIYQCPDSGLYFVSHDALPALRSQLRCYPLEPFLIQLGRISWTRLSDEATFGGAMQRQGWSPENTLRDYQLAFLAALKLRYAEETLATTTWPNSLEDAIMEVHTCTELVTQVLPQADLYLDHLPLERRRDILLRRISSQQFYDFASYQSIFPRAFLLFEKYSTAAAREKSFDINRVLRDRFGFDMQEWLIILRLFERSLHDRLLTPDFYVALTESHPEYPGITPNLLNGVLQQLSISPDSYRRHEANPKYRHREGYELYNFNLLTEYPIVQLGDKYIVPSARLFYQRIINGTFFDLLAAGGQPSQGKIGEVIGRAFEHYVQRLLADLPVNRTVRPGEADAGQGQRRQRRCDWILEGTDAIVLIECKRASLTQESRTTGDEQAIKKDLQKDGGIADGIMQLQETERAIRAGEIAGLDRNKPVIGMLVTMDEFWLPNSSPIRGILDEVVRDKHKTKIELQYQVCPVSGLEELIRFAISANACISQLLRRKVGNPEQENWDIAQWVRTILWETRGPDHIPIEYLPCHIEAINEIMPQALARFRDTG